MQAITQLADEYPWIDVDRVGITGASGGGLASTRAILQFPVSSEHNVML
eukprot:COSAG06_NODE_59809_length_273_cov_0.586207_1_plen_48_part_01